MEAKTKIITYLKALGKNKNEYQLLKTAKDREERLRK